MAADPLLFEVREALGIVQAELGRLIGVSRRTSQRLAVGESSLDQRHLITLARAVHPRNPALAGRIAARAGSTLVALGLEKPPAPAPRLGPPPKPAPSPHAVDALVCTLADSMGSTPRAARELLKTAFRRAKELDLSVEDVHAVLEEGES